MRFLLALVALLSAPIASGAAYSQPRSVAFAPDCRTAGAPPGARCGIIEVPEDRTRPGGRTLRLRFVIVPGQPGAPDDPIVYIAGGPGQSAVDGLSPVLPTLRAVDAQRTIIAMDQRGTGGSNPLHCSNGLSILGALADADAVRHCAERLREQADLDHYGSMDAVADLEDLRSALGLDQLNLVGVSYGVRVALLFMREHPRQVRSAILRAAYPADYNIIAEGVAAADSALAQLLDDCERDAACGRAFPALRDRLRALDSRLAENPVLVTTEGRDGRPVQMQVTRDLFHVLLVVMMQTAESRQYLPLLIANAEAEGFQPFAPILAQLQDGFSRLPLGMYLSVLCSEDAPRAHRLAAEPRTALSGTVAKLHRACAHWPVGSTPARALEPFSSDVPTLIVSGTLDPVTPPEASARLARALRRASHLLLPATAHAPMFPECLRPAVAAFLRTASPVAQDGACAGLALPPFSLPASAEPVADAAPPEAPSAAGIEGTWDLEWQTRRGTAHGGYLVIRQNGSRLDAELHGRGSLRVAGTMEGSRFTLRGARFFVTFTLTGLLSGDRIEGELRAMGVEQPFVGRRRAAAPAAAGPP